MRRKFSLLLAVLLFICSITTVSVSAMEADEVQNSNGTVGEGGARGKNYPRKKI